MTFRVLNSGGDGVNGINVSLELAGPNGGEYLNSESISSDANGYARVILNSGAVAGPVTISGTITTAAGDYTTNSSTISIGGGVPSAKTFSVDNRNFKFARFGVCESTNRHNRVLIRQV